MLYAAVTLGRSYGSIYTTPSGNEEGKQTEAVKTSQARPETSSQDHAFMPRKNMPFFFFPACLLAAQETTSELIDAPVHTTHMHVDTQLIPRGKILPV